MKLYLVRMTAFGHVGRFRSQGPECVNHGDRVLCRTPRGVEIGELLAIDETGADNYDGDLLRKMTPADDLLATRLEKNRDEAFEACVRLLDEKQIPAVLMDAELLFDGNSLYFYFLGEPPEEAEAITAELAEAYEAQVQLKRFADTLAEGCGPDCGTEAAGACGTSEGCSTCAAAAACKK